MNQHQDYDKIFKENFQKMGQRLLSKLLGIENITFQDLRSTLPRTVERRSDFAASGINPITKMEEIYHFEFQSQVHLKMIQRGLMYYGLYFEAYELPVNQYVIYLGNGNWTAETNVVHRNLNYSYDVIVLKELDYELFLDSDSPEEIVFSILADFKGEQKAKVIQKIIKTLETKIKNHKKRQKFFLQLEILSNLRNLQAEIIKQFSTMSIHFDIKKDLRFQQGVEIGNEQGIEIGISQKNKDFVLSLLANTDFDNEKIAQIVGVSVEFVQNLKKS